MKYKLEESTDKKVFIPFSLTLTFETEEEYKNFHDNVMNRITGVSKHEFHSDFFHAGTEGDESEGQI